MRRIDAAKLGARLCVFLASASLFGSLTGCVTYTTSREESPIRWHAVEQLETGETTLAEAIRTLGSPLEMHRHTDGTLAVYRHRLFKDFEMQLGPSAALRFFDLTQVTSEILRNLSFTREWIHSGEDRVVLLFDREQVLQAIGIDKETDDLPTM